MTESCFAVKGFTTRGIEGVEAIAAITVDLILIVGLLVLLFLCVIHWCKPGGQLGCRAKGCRTKTATICFILFLCAWMGINCALWFFFYFGYMFSNRELDAADVNRNDSDVADVNRDNAYYTTTPMQHQQYFNGFFGRLPRQWQIMHKANFLTHQIAFFLLCWELHAFVGSLKTQLFFRPNGKCACYGWKHLARGHLLVCNLRS